MAQAEALTDAERGPADDWPDGWPDHAEAFTVALRAVDDALSDEAAPPGCCDHCIGYRRGQLDAEEHARVLAASRAPGAEYMALGVTLHTLGCRVARAHSPLLVDPGGWRGKTLPVYLRTDEAIVWLMQSGRKPCKICNPHPGNALDATSLTSPVPCVRSLGVGENTGAYGES